MVARKVIIVSHEYPPEIGGAGSYAFDLANALTDQNVDITILTKKVKKRKNTNKKIKLIEVQTYSKLAFYNLWRCMKEINLKQYDYIILNDHVASQMGAFFFDKDIYSKTICYLHGSEPEKIFKHSSLTKKLINYKNRYSKLLHRCFKIICVSKDMKDKFIEISKLYSLENNIYVITNGVNKRLFYPKPLDIYTKYNICSDKQLFLSVSRITKGKGYDNKLKIFEMLKEKGLNFHWIVAGDGNYLYEFKERVNNSIIKDDVEILGRIDRERLTEIYSSVDFFILLSNYRESFGLVYLEANACGTPVIGNNYGGVKEAIIDGYSGFLINSNDIEASCNFIFNLMNNQEYISQLRKNSLFHANSNSILIKAQDLLDLLYNDI